MSFIPGPKEIRSPFETPQDEVSTIQPTEEEINLGRSRSLYSYLSC